MRGTAMHEAVELLLDMTPVQTGDIMTNGYVLEETDVEDIHVVVDWVVDQEFENIWIEQRMPIGQALGLNQPDLMWGTSDITAIKDNNLYIIDAKFGFVDVPAFENDQATCYTIGANFQFPSPSKSGEYDRFYAVIIQPRAGGVKIWDFGPKDLELMKRDVLESIKLMRRDDAQFNPGEDQCRFCPAAGSCQAQMDYMIGEDFNDLEELQGGVLDNDAMAQLLNKDAQIRKALDAVKSQALERLAMGQLIPGWKRVRGNTRAKWSDESEVLVVLEAEGLDLDVYAPRKPATQTLLKKVLTPQVVETLIVRPEGSPALVKADDKRDSMDSDFQVLDD